MTLEELWEQVERDRAAIQAFGKRTNGRRPTAEESEEFGTLMGASSFNLQLWEIARDFGMAAATAFKLSDGNIDPR